MAALGSSDVAIGYGATRRISGPNNDPLRYRPLPHILLLWRALCIDSNDDVRRALVRAGVIAQLAALVAAPPVVVADCAMSCVRFFFKVRRPFAFFRRRRSCSCRTTSLQFPRWQELMIADGLLSALATCLASYVGAVSRCRRR